MEEHEQAPRRGPRFTPAQVGAALVAFVLGGVVAIIVDRALDDAGPMRAQETLAEAPVGTLTEMPPAPVQVLAERVRLPSGFTSERFYGGPAFTFVDTGQIEVTVDGEASRYGPGAFFFLPAGQLHELRALETSQIALVRLVPEGAEPTTEVR